MEGILGAATVRDRVRQRPDSVEHLDHRAGPAVGHDQRQRVVMRRADVDEVDVHAVDLAAIPLRAIVERNDLDPGLVDDVIMGNVGQVGEQGYNVGRNALLAAGFPESVPGVTIDRHRVDRATIRAGTLTLP